jgi:hypothetical protein
MKKMVAIGCMLALAAGMARADVYTLTVTITNNQTAAYSDPIPVAGYLDKVEIAQSAATSTGGIMLATFSGTTAVDIYVTNNVTAVRKIVRPRVIGTTTAGTDLAAVTASASTSTNECTTTLLKGVYERLPVGSNFKLKYWGGNVASGVTLTNTVRIFTVKDR